MKLSVILATIHSQKRIVEITRLLQSLNQQTYKNFELIIADQNDTNVIEEILKDERITFDVKSVKSPKGLSVSRNFVIPYCVGNIILFADDDCWYDSDTFERVTNFFQSHGDFDILTCKACNENGVKIASFDDVSGECDIYNIFNRVCSIGLFVKADVFKLCNFNENLGLGSKTRWKGCEDYEFPINAIKHGVNVYYDHNLSVRHPLVDIGYSRDSILRAKDQSPSYGCLLRMHKYPLNYILYRLVRPFGGVLISLLTLNLKKAYYHFAVFAGRIKGLIYCDL